MVFTSYTTADAHFFVLQKVSLSQFRGILVYVMAQRILSSFECKSLSCEPFQDDAYTSVMEQLQNLDEKTDTSLASLVYRFRRGFFPPLFTFTDWIALCSRNGT